MCYVLESKYFTVIISFNLHKIPSSLILYIKIWECEYVKKITCGQQHDKCLELNLKVVFYDIEASVLMELFNFQMYLMCSDGNIVVTVRNGIVSFFFHWKFILKCLSSSQPYPGPPL